MEPIWILKKGGKLVCECSVEKAFGNPEVWRKSGLIINVEKRMNLSQVDKILSAKNVMFTRGILTPASKNTTDLQKFDEFVMYLKQRDRAGVAEIDSYNVILLLPPSDLSIKIGGGKDELLSVIIEKSIMNSLVHNPLPTASTPSAATARVEPWQQDPHYPILTDNDRINDAIASSMQKLLAIQHKYFPPPAAAPYVPGVYPHFPPNFYMNQLNAMRMSSQPFNGLQPPGVDSTSRTTGQHPPTLSTYQMPPVSLAMPEESLGTETNNQVAADVPAPSAPHLPFLLPGYLAPPQFGTGEYRFPPPIQMPPYFHPPWDQVFACQPPQLQPTVLERPTVGSDMISTGGKSSETSERTDQVSTTEPLQHITQKPLDEVEKSKETIHKGPDSYNDRSVYPKMTDAEQGSGTARIPVPKRKHFDKESAERRSSPPKRHRLEARPLISQRDRTSQERRRDSLYGKSDHKGGNNSLECSRPCLSNREESFQKERSTIRRSFPDKEVYQNREKDKNMPLSHRYLDNKIYKSNNVEKVHERDNEFNSRYSRKKENYHDFRRYSIASPERPRNEMKREKTYRRRSLDRRTHVNTLKASDAIAISDSLDLLNLCADAAKPPHPIIPSRSILGNIKILADLNNYDKTEGASSDISNVGPVCIDGGYHHICQTKWKSSTRNKIIHPLPDGLHSNVEWWNACPYYRTSFRELYRSFHNAYYTGMALQLLGLNQQKLLQDEQAKSDWNTLQAGLNDLSLHV